MAAAAHLGSAEHEDHHHGPPVANRSSRVDPATLGMMLFIISEIMVFGAFFTAYFFIRVVGGAEWPAEGDHLAEHRRGLVRRVVVVERLTSSRLTDRDRRRRRSVGIGLDDRTEPPQIADDFFLDAPAHVLEQLEALLLVLDQRIALAIAAQADSLLQVIE